MKRVKARKSNVALGRSQQSDIVGTVTVKCVGFLGYLA